MLNYIITTCRRQASEKLNFLSLNTILLPYTLGNIYCFAPDLTENFGKNDPATNSHRIKQAAKAACFNLSN
ncbi:MAG: hypothetical protein CML20_17350 [Rheinheimera sp.]|nr:hypothetical protein [Rheinheimera sp.]